MNGSRLGGLAVVLMSMVACASTSGGDPQPRMQNQMPNAVSDGRGSVGDTIYLVELPVRPERRDQFEAFVREVLWPAFERRAAARPAGQVQRIRLLQPLTASGDGSYTYTFILDPVVIGESYNVLDVLREAYGEAEAMRHYGFFTATWSDDFTSRRYVQAR